MSAPSWICRITAQARPWLDTGMLQRELVMLGGTLYDETPNPCEILVTSGMDDQREQANRFAAREVVAITPLQHHYPDVTDITPSQFHAELAEASILAVLEHLYDLHKTEKSLREQSPRTLNVKATMLKGKRLQVIADERTSTQIAQRLRGWGVIDLCAQQTRHCSEADTVNRAGATDPDVVVNATASARIRINAAREIFPTLQPTIELRQASVEAVITSIRSRKAHAKR